MPQMQVQCQPV